MKKLLFSCLFAVSFLNVFATHIIGGEMRYEYIGPGGSPGSKMYRIRLLLLKGSSAIGAALQSQYIVGVFNNDNGSKVLGTATNSNWAANEDFAGVLPVPVISSPCIQNPPNLGYTYKRYSFIIELPDNNSGYTIAFQTFSRQNSNNILDNQGATYSCVIPGRNVLPAPGTDTSPEYKLPVSVICENSPFTLDFSAPDPNIGDSVVYDFCDAQNGGAANSGAFDDPAPPPYGTVSYTFPYNSSIPLGSLASINHTTGLISGTAPGGGRYVVCVCASVFRDGVLITVHRKDLIVEVSGCIPLTAIPNFAPITCDGFTVTFSEASTGNPDTYRWDFGDPASGASNTSGMQIPTHTFTTAGIYNVKLVVSIQGQCIDSVTKPISVFPGFFPGFITSPALCVGQPVQFTDTTKTNYGVVDSWRWDFGDPPPIFSDTSHLQNPLYTYNQSGNYSVELKVTNSKGCEKTIFIPITVSDLPVIDIFPADTIYCGLDSIQLTGTGTGSFSWTPNTNIIGANTATPSVFPLTATKYYATLTNAAGCKNKDSVTVTPKRDLANGFTGPSPICEEDTVTLTGTSNYAPYVTWQWSPAATVESPTSSVTRVFPSVTTNYTLLTTWGKHCIINASKIITVKPLAIPDAGPSPAICGGQQSAQLNAGGGNTYSWSPPTGLSDPTIRNPIASPGSTTIYTVSVGVTGCPKTRDDSLIVYVRDLPPLTLINDTLICNIDTLQLTTTGAGAYNWSPNYMISSTSISSPLVSPDISTKYFVSLTDAFGCRTNDSVFVDVKDHVSLFVGNDTTLCRTDGFFLNTISDALHYKWTPATYLNFDTAKRPFAIPLTSTTYHLVANIGKCQSQDEIDVKIVPYPAANAGLDTAICPGFSAQLLASGGSSYLWTPATFLSNRNIANPAVIRPSASIRYIVAVTDTLGCPKPVRDTVWVNVYPKVVANAGPRDTNIVTGEPVLLNASGGATYLWDPPTWLSNPLIRNPVSLPQGNIQYIVTATSAIGNCIGTDTIMIHLFNVVPDIYVPTAFTPNGDGNNDVLRPILLGMKELRYFKVYNRFGNLLYSTTDIGKGWNGIYAGKGQDPATYVWMAEGITFKGDVRFKKGYAVLIRE
jgi:gliding motility-associated-like protein